MAGDTVRQSVWSGRREVMLVVAGRGAGYLEPAWEPRGWRGDDEGAYLTAQAHILMFRSSPTLR